MNSDNTKGYIQVYTGNGKGKTTAAIELSIRALGAGKKVFFGQFVKGQVYSEVKAIQDFSSDIVIKNKPEKTEIVVTGRYAPEPLINLADLVTEMKEVKHYYTKGIEACLGIEC